MMKSEPPDQYEELKALLSKSFSPEEGEDAPPIPIKSAIESGTNMAERTPQLTHLPRAAMNHSSQGFPAVGPAPIQWRAGRSSTRSGSRLSPDSRSK